MSRCYIIRRRIVVSPPKNKKHGGGGWLLGAGLLGALVVIGKLTGGASHSLPPAAGPARRVIATGEGWRSNRCDVQGTANGAAFTFEIDTGAGDAALFSSSHLSKLNVNPKTLHYEEWWPGTRYGKIATTNLREIRIGEVVWNNPEVRIYSNWRFAFGDDEIPLLGLPALNAKGINVEFVGGSCRLTVARS